jgi:hypothetical protein
MPLQRTKTICVAVALRGPAAHAIGTSLVLLNLLESQTDGFAEVRLGHA